MNALSIVWLTRDSDTDDGGLSPVIDVWSSRPERTHDELGAYWLADTDAQHLGHYKIESARARFKTIPDTDLECIRMYVRTVPAP